MGANPEPVMIGGLLLSETSFTNGFWAPHEGHTYFLVVSAMIVIYLGFEGFYL
jgi:hypothetical protein